METARNYAYALLLCALAIRIVPDCHIMGRCYQLCNIWQYLYPHITFYVKRSHTFLTQDAIYVIIFEINIKSIAFLVDFSINAMNTSTQLQLNAGFIAHENVGYSREFTFEIPELTLGADLALKSLTGTAAVTSTLQGLVAQLNFQATIHLDCVRCLNRAEQPLKIEFSVFFAFKKKHTDETGLRFPDNGIIDLEPLVYEYFVLSIPISPQCRPDCKGLCPVCGENRNEVDCDHDERPIDPRLAQLKSLLDDD